MWASKAALAELSASAGMPVSIDETNADVRHRRNAVRAHLAQLERALPGASQAIARSAAIAADDRALLDMLASSAWARCRISDEGVLSAVALRALPGALLRRVLRHAVRRATGDVRDFTFDQCAAIARAINDRRGGSHQAGAARVVLSAGQVTVHSTALDESEEEDERRVEVPRSACDLELQRGTISLRSAKASRTARRTAKAGSVLRLDGTVLNPGLELVIRTPRSGDKIVPSGRHTPVALSRFLAKAGLTRREREIVPLICHDGAIAAVVGVRADARYAAKPGRDVLEVRWSPVKVVRHPGPADE
jgi:tRNA(Ile)-lysidine synthetase-like protein